MQRKQQNQAKRVESKDDADNIYRNRENLNYCKTHGIRLSDPALGRPRKDETRDKAQDYRDECERVEVERRFSLQSANAAWDW